MKKIIVAHPEKQHSYRLAYAAYEAGMLEEYITTVYYKPRNLTGFLEKLTRGKLRLKSIRKMLKVPDVMVRQFCELRGIILLVLRHTKYKKLINKIQNINFDIFGKKVASEAVKHKVNAVVLYDTNSLECFRKLQGTGIIRIMDTSIANRHYTKQIYDSVIQKQEDWNRFSENDILLNEIEMKRLLDEIKLTDFFLVPSTFVRDSLLYSGVDPKQIRIVPYGVDSTLFQFSKRRNNIESGPLEILFVGQCSYRKGINYLLEAVSKKTEDVRLTVVGDYSRIMDLYNKYCGYDNIVFLGRVQHEKLPEIYEKADIFALPSLSEGMSLVGLEAMASGVPLLCSKNCGVNDVVVENVNGWILDEISTQGILEKINIINTKRTEILKMGFLARKTAEQYSWENYSNKMADVLKSIMGE